MPSSNPSIVKHNALILSNASALTSAIISEIGEKNISKTMNGESLTRDRIEQMAMIKLTHAIQSNL